MEKEIEDLKIRISNYSKNINYDQYYLANEIFNDNEKHEKFFQQLNDEFQRIDTLVFQANTIANEMQEEVVYKTILHTPVSYFKPKERNLTNLCEIGVQVTYEGLPVELWDREKFEWKLGEIKEEYDRWKTSENSKPILNRQSESLIGVANIYLKALFYNSKFDYIVPIINTEGKICGSLHVVIDPTESSSSMKALSDFQINSSISDGIGADIDEQSLSNSQPSLDEGIDELSALSNWKNDHITVKFAIKEARDLPKMNVEHIICRYAFINPKLDQTAISIKSSDNENKIFSFDHENEYTFPITDDFLSTCHEGSVSIEVWSQCKPKERPIETAENAKVQEIGRRWRHVKRNVQFSLEIQELDSTGQWNSVEINGHEKTKSAGIYRLKQGQSKRVITRLRVLPRSDSMSLSFHAIRSVEIGSISTRKLDAPCQLDSYQEEDLTELKCQWLELIDKQKDSLVSQVNLINQQTEKTSEDTHRETILLNQLMRLTEEQNIAMFPPASTGIPGAPAGWDPPMHVEMHRPLLFLNINEPNEIAGLLTTLAEEDQSQMKALPLIQQESDETRAVALWNPSIHESNAINQPTPQDTVIYLIVKVTALINEPVQMEVILRKRIAVTISKTESWWPGKILKNILNDKPHKTTSVVYEIVSTIPRMIFTIENSQCLSEKSIEKYLQHASAIDSVLLLDKLRQEVLLAEKSAKRQTLHKSTSAPHITPQKVNYEPEILIQREPDLSSSTSSLLSRMSFLEGVQPVQTPTFRITRTIDLEVDQEENNESTLELKYLLSPEQIIENKPKDYSIGCRVIVNTGQSVVNQPGIIRFIGEISVKEGIWYGIELNEPIGKNNGSLEGNIYFHCSDKHGVFVRRDKLRFVD